MINFNNRHETKSILVPSKKGGPRGMLLSKEIRCFKIKNNYWFF